MFGIPFSKKNKKVFSNREKICLIKWDLEWEMIVHNLINKLICFEVSVIMEKGLEICLDKCKI